MEKLQAALNKARQKRAALAPDVTPADPMATMEPAKDNLIETGWAGIPMIEIDPTKAARRRLVALRSGKNATPYDVLRTKVLQYAKSNGWHRVAITSPSPGSGKTTTSLNLAVSLARQQDLKVMLMDMDMRRPALAKTLGYNGTIEFSSVLEGTESYSRQARRVGENLSISMNFTASSDPSVLFLKERTSAIIDQIDQDYRPDILLFDMPPMMVNDDTAAFLKNVDCAIIVAEAGVSTVNQVDICEKELAEQTNVLGVVLNKCRFHSDDYGYYHYKSGY